MTWDASLVWQIFMASWEYIFAMFICTNLWHSPLTQQFLASFWTVTEFIPKVIPGTDPYSPWQAEASAHSHKFGLRLVFISWADSKEGKFPTCRNNVSIYIIMKRPAYFLGL